MITNLISEFDVTYKDHEETSWDRRINFIYKGEKYYVNLSWNSYDGYEMNWFDERRFAYVPCPEWASDWENEESLEFILDCASEEGLANAKV